MHKWYLVIIKKINIIFWKIKLVNISYLRRLFRQNSVTYTSGLSASKKVRRYRFNQIQQINNNNKRRISSGAGRFTADYKKHAFFTKDWGERDSIPKTYQI